MTPAAPTPRGTPRGGVALVLIGASLVLFWAAAVAGPSAVSHDLPSDGWLPPYSIGLHPSPWLAVALLWIGTAFGAAGTLLALRTVRSGWSPRPTALLAGAVLAVVAFALVPPVNSDDVYSYAAYGRMVAIGRNPYTTAPVDLPADPVARAVTPPWREEPSVYGPIATGEQALVMRAAGASVRWGVLSLTVAGAIAFLAVAAVLQRSASDEAARRRAALSWALNPLLLFHLVGGAHLDALGILAMLAGAMLAARKLPAAAGAALGAAIAVKLTGGVAAIGLAWSLRTQPRRLAMFIAGGVLVVIPLYLLAGGTTALRQARAASRFVSHASWWRPIVVQFGASRQTVSLLSLGALLALAWLLTRTLPPAAPGLPAVARVLLAPTLAWLLTATYTLPWYAAWAWPLVALLAASRWDDVLLAWTAVLTLAYMPGRDVALPAGLSGITRWLRAGLGPVALATLLLAAVLMATRRRSAESAA